jgi:hypothetical protein
MAAKKQQNIRIWVHSSFGVNFTHQQALSFRAQREIPGAVLLPIKEAGKQEFRTIFIQ